MPNALIITTGSRGDTEPMLALAVSLVQSGKFEHVHVCMQPDFLHLAPSDPAIICHALPFSMKAIVGLFLPVSLKSALSPSLLRRKSYNDKVRQMNNVLAQLLKRFVVLSMPHLIEIAECAKPAIIVSNILTAAVCHSLAEYVRVPMTILNLQPTTHSMSYPYPFSDMYTSLKAAENIASIHRDEPQEDVSNITSYDSMLDGLHNPALPGLNAYRKSLGMSAVTVEILRDAFAGRLPAVNVVNAYPSELIPHDSNWPESVRTLPPLAVDYIPPDWNAEKKCPKLVKYLASGDKPFCITFGSVNMMNRLTSRCRALLVALRNAGLSRVLLLKGKVELGSLKLGLNDRELNKWADEHVYFCDERPQYAWLFPQCSGVMCHGGPGTVYAALKVGLPVAVAPLICDQFFMARLVRELKLGGAVECEGKNLTGAYEEALKVCLSEEVGENVRVIGERMRKRGNGAKILAEVMGGWVDECDGLSTGRSFSM